MKAQELYDEWTEGDTSGVRPARLQELRPRIREYTGLYVPRSRAEIDSWLPRMKGQITKKLRQAAEAEREEEESDDDESNDDSEAQEGDSA